MHFYLIYLFISNCADASLISIRLSPSLLFNSFFICLISLFEVILISSADIYSRIKGLTAGNSLSSFCLPLISCTRSEMCWRK